MAQCVKNPENECIGLAQAQILEQEIRQMRERHEQDIKQIKEQQTREYEQNRDSHKEFYKRLEFGEQAQAVTQNQLAQILSDTGDIKNSLESQNQEIRSLQQKPAKRWESIVDKFIAFLIGLAGALFYFKIGL